MRCGTEIEGWVKRNDRRAVDLAATAYRHDGTSLAVVLKDMSYDGCLLQAETMFVIGEKIRLILPRMGEVPAQIRWASHDGRAGARFLLNEIVPQDRHSTMGL